MQNIFERDRPFLELIYQDRSVSHLVFLSEFLLLPHNDFALACVLKSPFGGLEEEDLFILATTRGDKSLWENLKIHHTQFKDLVECFFDRQLLTYNLPVIEVNAGDQKRMVVDMYVRYRIVDILTFFKNVGTKDLEWLLRSVRLS